MTDASGPGPGYAGGRLTINLGALADNWRTLVAEVGHPAKTAAVVKADGYGIGAMEAAEALAASGCSTFFVGLPDEGVQLRRALPSATIYVLAGLIPGSVSALASAHLRPVLGSIPEVDEWISARHAGVSVPAAIHVDTGMNRLGLSVEEASTLAGDGRLANAAPALLMSHLACADVPGHPLNARQLERFSAMHRLFPGVPASLANSAGIYLGRNYHFDLVRPGMALYGGVFSESRPPLRTVVTVEARVLQVRDAKAGETVGYGATQTFAGPTRLAILGVGYADGFHRAASPRKGKPGPRVVVRGRSAPIVGRVSMDLIAIDVTGIPGVERGDWAELFGPTMPVDESALTAGTVGYEFLTGLGRRYAKTLVIGGVAEELR